MDSHHCDRDRDYDRGHYDRNRVRDRDCDHDRGHYDRNRDCDRDCDYDRGHYDRNRDRDCDYDPDRNRNLCWSLQMARCQTRCLLSGMANVIKFHIHWVTDTFRCNARNLLTKAGAHQ